MLAAGDVAEYWAQHTADTTNTDTTDNRLNSQHTAIGQTKTARKPGRQKDMGTDSQTDIQTESMKCNVDFYPCLLLS